ncbi:sulfate transport system substrate-binding protein [Frankineae bacterium MT45]|nr:sulfate transport system substrate-binding protein [Frankineae bacterium MT45]
MIGTRFRKCGKLTTLVASVATVALGVTACSSSSASGSTELKLVAYSVPKPAYDALQAAFGKTSAGKGVTWKSSYGASGTQSKNVSAGTVKADYVAFSVTPDLTKLVPKYVDAGWNSGPTKGMVSDSVVVISVRKGNPLHITGWDDLIKPGVKIVTPDPASSGSAKWNILAAYSHVEAAGGTEAEAKDYLTKFFGNVVSRASSGAVATTQFLGGTGDVLISYENEAIASRQAGKSLDYIVPDQTILIENPAAVTKTAPTQAKDFLTFLLSSAGQQIFASKGYRPVVAGTTIGTVEGANDPSNPFPTPKKLVTIADLGGWTAVNAKFFGPTGLVTQIEKTG